MLLIIFITYSTVKLFYVPTAMTNVTACRVCLMDSIRMFPIRNTHLQEVYEKLANTQLNADDGRPQTVCRSCHSQLQICRKLIDMSQKAERILEHVIRNGLEFSQDIVVSLNGGTPLNCDIHNTSYYNLLETNESNSDVEIAVKEEQLVKAESTDYEENDQINIKIEEVPVAKKRKIRNKHSVTKPKKRKTEIEFQVKNNYKKASTEHYQRHIMQRIAGEKPFACDKCNKAFSQMGNLTRHKRLHTGGKPHVCDICSKTFAEKVYLKVHRRIHTGENRFACGKCSKTFVQKCNLQRHERIHTGEKPFACSRCHKTFSDMSQLKCHMRFHTQEKPYACDRCGLRFSNVSNFNSHMRTHTGEKPYSCNVCYKSFPRSTTLRSHMLIHTGEKPYDCNKCNKKFNSCKYLKRHMRVHTGEKPYACDICDKTFTVKKSLKKHVGVHTGEKS